MAMKPIPQHFDDLPASAQVPARTLASLLDVSEVTIWRWSKIGKLPRPRKLGGNTTRFNVGEVRAAFAKLAA
jgi:predicted DNA-binding transcriptional regulator AlpA